MAETELMVIRYSYEALFIGIELMGISKSSRVCLLGSLIVVGSILSFPAHFSTGTYSFTFSGYSLDIRNQIREYNPPPSGSRVQRPYWHTASCLLLNRAQRPR